MGLSHTHEIIGIYGGGVSRLGPMKKKRGLATLMPKTREESERDIQPKDLRISVPGFGAPGTPALFSSEEEVFCSSTLKIKDFVKAGFLNTHPRIPGPSATATINGERSALAVGLT